MERQRRSREEVPSAIEKLKTKHPTAVHTVDSLSSVYSMMELDDEKETAEGPD